MCWNWNEGVSLINEECINGKNCVLNHICMNILPSGVMCRSRGQTFVEHEMFYKYGRKEKYFMEKYGMIGPREADLIDGMINSRQVELDMIDEAKGILECVGQEVVCTDVVGTEKVKVPFKVPFGGRVDHRYCNEDHWV